MSNILNKIKVEDFYAKIVLIIFMAIVGIFVFYILRNVYSVYEYNITNYLISLKYGIVNFFSIILKGERL
jgi:hypothetical protein